MENISVTVFEPMVNSFTDADELMNFAMAWGLLESPRCGYDYFSLETRSTVVRL